jgi:predicted DNA-binding protein
MEKLQVEAKEGTKRFTIDLRESVHRKLSILSAKTGRSKADIIRMVLDDVLKDVEE